MSSIEPTSVSGALDPALRPRWSGRLVIRRVRSLWRRWFLWLLLALLVLALLITVVWLAGRHEIDQVQGALDRDTADAVADLRSGLQRNAQSLQALRGERLEGEAWAAETAALLRARREWLRLERRDAALRLVAFADTPYRARVFGDDRRADVPNDVALACGGARKRAGIAYSASRYVPSAEGIGLEVMEMCLPLDDGGYLMAAYSLRDTLSELVAPALQRGQEVSFTEVDGTRLATVGAARRVGTRVFTAQQLIDLPGPALMLRVDGRRAAPDLFPNMLTGVVTAISIALVSVLVLLARDTRMRLKAERQLADSLAFRKAMEDSVVTGLRARDLHGRITYVNPAFCQMVGFGAEELVGTAAEEAPYWPTDLAQEYRARQRERLAGGVPPREGFESVFMRKDGTRFPVLIFEAPLLNAQRLQTGWMSASIDISEQRHVEELARAGQERLQASARLATAGEMASLLSHELTQPLAAIASYATGSLNLLADGQDLPTARPELATAMRRIAQQADRAGQVIRSVHDFVRRRDRMRETVAPQALIDAVLPLVPLQARKLSVGIHVVTEEELPAVVCDRTLVEQVLLNLARNAMQAMDEPGLDERALVLRIVRSGAGTADARRWLEFSVADVGTGISEQVAARLFTPFFTTRSEGMGLGLSLCRTVVEQHGGALVFEPNQPRGTVFRFTLPVAPTQPATTRA